ncbi:CheY-homologous receiver domain and PAS domain-containing protein [Klebsormidium nitens]|uniref:histidine kinase n=1 Tax=Klebsormidium nitens TaxID=105231 RepID=A0A1Y1IM18_KLENI|nr:CheY-homologous receiver domain and PAS domain-containing protein [Klebsormidium nitens]|eukprot:GAQ91844.1 CheY-homologous receiver domain and PAS domain-containing protein [Klebsormidium nitens]
MESERLKSYRRWYKELDARKAELEEEGLEDPRTLKLLEGELRCLEELITLDSQLMLHLPDACGQGGPPDAESLVSRNVSTWPGDSGLPPVEGLDLSLVTDMLILSATSPWVVFVAERFKWNTVYVSPSAKRLLGWRQQELVGVPVSDRCHPDDVPTMLNMFNAGANSSGNSLYYRRMRRDRSYVAVQGTGRILGQRWFAWMELLVAEAEPAPPSGVGTRLRYLWFIVTKGCFNGVAGCRSRASSAKGAGSPMRRASPPSPPTSARSRLMRAPTPPDMPSLPATAFFPGAGNSSFASFPAGGNSLASSRNLSSQSINELVAMPSVRHSLGGSPPAARQSSSAPLNEKKELVHSIGGSYVEPQRASTGALPVGPLEMVRRKGSRPTSPLSEQDSEQSFNSGRYNGQDVLGFSHSTGALGLSSSALNRTIRPSEGLRSETLVSMNSAERLRTLSHRSSLRGSGSSGTPSNSSPSVENGAPLLPSEIKLFPRQGAQNEPHMSPPSQPLSRSGSGSSGGGKSLPPGTSKVGLEFAYGALVGEKEGERELLRTSVDYESVLDASGLVGTPLYKEASNVDLDDQERWRLQNEESNSDIGLSNSILVPVSGGASPKLPPVSVAAPVPRPPGGKPEGELDGIRGARVLLVEDDVTNRTVGQRLLESLHCEVTVTCNGKEALEAMRGNPEDPFSLSELGEDEELPPRFDLVLMDLLMPVMDGLRAVEKFRDEEQDQKPRRKRMLIFALTGNVSDGDMVKCAQSGFDEFVSKPLTVEKLLHRLYGVCKTTDRFPGLRTSNFALPS